MVKHVLDTLEGLPEALQAEYKKGEDGKFYLNVEGGEDVNGLKKAKDQLLDEKKKLQDRLKAFEGLGDPEEAKKILEKANELARKEREIEEKKLIESGELEKVVNLRTDAMKRDHAEQVKALTELNTKADTELGKLKVALNKAVIERGIVDAVNAVGQIRKEALEDIIARGGRTWQLDENGVPVPHNSDGTIIYGKDAQKPQTMAEWAEKLLTDAPHLFAPSTGGGAKGSGEVLGGRRYTQEELSKLSPTAKLQLARSNSGQ